jgi:hypothetical protein
MLDKIEAVAVGSPEVFHYCYTKALKLDWSRFKALKNTKVIQSDGGRWSIDRRSPHALVLDQGARIPVGYVDASASDLVALKHNRIALYRR